MSMGTSPSCLADCCAIIWPICCAKCANICIGFIMLPLGEPASASVVDAGVVGAAGVLFIVLWLPLRPCAPHSCSSFMKSRFGGTTAGSSTS
eukprot:7302977-Pyramimonas_sp.AAC.1